MFKKSTMFALACTMLLAACGKPNSNCSDAGSQSALEAAIREGLEKSILAQAKGDDGVLAVEASKVRAAIADLKLVIENIRTTKEDPNSTKKFCTGNLKIVFGTHVFADAEKSREIAGMPTLTQAVDRAALEKGVDYLKGDLDYSVQPTDDGSKVVAEFEAASNKLDVFGEVVAASLLKGNLENKQRMDQANAAAADKATQDALTAERQANLQQALVSRKAADVALGAAWQSLDPGMRQQLLPQQRAWIKRKDASCTVQGLQASTDPTEQKTAAENCVVSETQNRTNELQNYIGQTAM